MAFLHMRNGNTEYLIQRTDEELLLLKSMDGAEQVHKIWALMGHVSKLKIRLDKVMSGIAGESSLMLIRAALDCTM